VRKHAAIGQQVRAAVLSNVRLNVNNIIHYQCMELTTDQKFASLFAYTAQTTSKQDKLLRMR